ncbi:MAG: mechanosensitive ion channel family protein, partial [Hyphomicrobiaceae bacterium]
MAIIRILIAAALLITPWLPAMILFALSRAGFDIPDLALIAGLLFTGTGLAMLPLFNNVVSGLILLFERPVKVGDWIVVGADEGIVRRLSVLSTEIETFDRSSVVIPNSELITGRVKNWTLRDPLGRVRLPIGIAYAADPELAAKIMLDVAGQHPRVLRTPEPFVSFETFADSTINLILNVYVAEVRQSGSIRTELAYAVLKAFKAAS